MTGAAGVSLTGAASVSLAIRNDHLALRKVADPN